MLTVYLQVRPVSALQQTHYLIYGTMMDFSEGRLNNPTADFEEKGSLTRGNNAAQVKGNGQGTMSSFHPSQMHGWCDFSGYVKQESFR